MNDSENAHIANVPLLLREFERRLDDAYAAFGDLAGVLPRARLEARLSAVVGQSIFEKISEAGMAIGTARGHTVGAHRLLEKVAKSIGMDDGVALGDERPKPNVFTTAEADIVPIAAARAA